MLDSLKGAVAKLLSALIDLFLAELILWGLARSGHYQVFFERFLVHANKYIVWDFLWDKRFFLFHFLALYLVYHGVQILCVLIMKSSIGDKLARDSYQNATRLKIIVKVLLDLILLPLLVFHFSLFLGGRTFPEWLLRLKKKPMGVFRLSGELILLPLPLAGLWLLLFFPLPLDYSFEPNEKLDNERELVKDINRKEDFNHFKFHQSRLLSWENFSTLQGERGEFLPMLALSAKGKNHQMTTELWYWKKDSNEVLWKLSQRSSFETKKFFEKVLGSGLLLSGRYPHLLQESAATSELPVSENSLRDLENFTKDVLASRWQYNLLNLLTYLPYSLESAAFFHLLSKELPVGSYQTTQSKSYVYFWEQGKKQVFVLVWGTPISNVFQLDLSDHEQANKIAIEFFETSRWKKIQESKGSAFILWDDLEQNLNSETADKLYAFYFDFFKKSLEQNIVVRQQISSQLENLATLAGEKFKHESFEKSFKVMLAAFTSGQKDFFGK